MIADQGWDLHLFPLNVWPTIPMFRNITVHHPWKILRKYEVVEQAKRYALRYAFNNKSVQIHPSSITERAIYPLALPQRLTWFMQGFKTTLGAPDAQASHIYGPRVLARLIKKLKPDLIHSMEFQHCSYNVLEARQYFAEGTFPKWLATNWGSDIYHFRHQPAHESQIRKLLAAVDFYNCECGRDVRLARELGLTGQVLPVRPNSGGFNLPFVKQLRSIRKTSKRRVIMVKGYQHFAGRALTALEALAKASDVLDGYKIVIYSPSDAIYVRVDELRQYYNLDITIMHNVDHAKMLRMFAAARLYLGVSVSDAISTSMLEAMALGAFPIQTNTACCDEWIEDGRTGFSIPPDDTDFIADRIRQAISNDELVDRAAELNWDIVASRLNEDDLKRQVIQDYRFMLNLDADGNVAQRARP